MSLIDRLCGIGCLIVGHDWERYRGENYGRYRRCMTCDAWQEAVGNLWLDCLEPANVKPENT